VFPLPIIKKITVQKKNKERYNIFFDQGDKEEYAFSVSQDVLIKYDLRKGKELSSEDIELIFQNDELQKAMNKSINYLSYRMRSEKEVRTNLLENEYSVEIVQKVISWLLERNYLNDSEFAKAYVKTQQNTTDKGPRLIENGLKEKGINSLIIEEVMMGLSFDEQLQKALKLCEKLAGKKKKVSISNLKNDMQSMLIRKGYPFDVINMAIDSSIKKVDIEQDALAVTIQGEKAWKKYRSEPIDVRKLKVKQFLYRKGFSLEHIDLFLEEKLMEENL
jgi:regulatory protein